MPISLKFAMALLRRCIHALPAAALDVLILRAARDAGAADAEVRALREMVSMEKRSRRG